MARDWIEQVFNRGLNWFKPKGALDRGQSYVLENVELTKDTVRGRKGFEDAYLPHPETTVLSSLLKRFYKLNANGTISKFFLRVNGAKLYKADQEWSDDTGATPGTTFTEISPPNLVSWTAGLMKHALQSKGWCYLYPDNALADNALPLVNIPIRTDGTNAYKMGLTPPPALLVDDHSLDRGPTNIKWATKFTDLINEDAHSNIVVDKNREKAYMAFRAADGFLDLATYDFSTDTWGVVDVESTKSVLGSQLTRAIVVALDIYDKPVIAWFATSGTSYLNYSYSGMNTAWTTDEVGAHTTPTYLDLALNSDGMPHIVVGGRALNQVIVGGHEYMAQENEWVTVGNPASGTWECGDPSIAFDGDDTLHISFGTSLGLGAGQDVDLYYNSYSASSWGTPVEIDATGTAPNLQGHANDISVNGNGSTVHVSYMYSPDFGDLKYARSTDSGATWGIKETVQADIMQTALDPTATAIVSVEDDFVVIGVMAGFEGSGTKQSPHLAYRVGTGDWEYKKIEDSRAGWDDFISLQYFVDAAEMYLGWGSFAGEGGFIHGPANVYHYKLTAEYDDAILGESAPSAARAVFSTKDIGTSRWNLLNLHGSNTYDMTADATRLNIYRTTKFSASTDIYYRVGFLELDANGDTQGDFTDAVSDLDLVSNPILDTDIFMPPKFKTGTFWRDHVVIGDTKARDTGATEGTELDLTENGIHHNRLRFSKEFQPDIFPSLYFIDLLPDGDSGKIQRVIVNPDTDQLYVFMERDTLAIVGDSIFGARGSIFRPVNIAQSKGTPAPDSVVGAKGMIFYWTNDGIEVIKGGQAMNITSDTIGGMWNQRDSSHPAFAYRINMAQIGLVEGVYDEEKETVRWSYPATSATNNSKELVLHLDRWAGRGDGVFSTNNQGFNTYMKWMGEGDRGELFGAANTTAGYPYTYRLNYSEEDNYSSAGAGSGIVTLQITSKIFTGLEDFDRPDLIKRFKNIRINGKSGTVDVDVVVDVDGVYTATLSNLDFSTGGIVRVASALPRYANGSRIGIQLTANHTIAAGLGPEAFEIYDLAWYLDFRKTRVRNVS